MFLLAHIHATFYWAYSITSLLAIDCTYTPSQCTCSFQSELQKGLCFKVQGAEEVVIRMERKEWQCPRYQSCIIRDSTKSLNLGLKRVYIQSKVCRRPAADLPQTCRRLKVCGKEYAEVCGRKKFCCRLAAYQYATGTVCGRSAAGWNFAADLPHTSMPQEQSAADLRQDETLLQTCRILVCHRNSLRQICGRMKLCSRLAAY